jgi:hypothetical protein
LAACGLEAAACLGIGLQVQRALGDQRKEEFVHVEAVAAEHAARAWPAQAGEQFQAVGDEVGVGAGHRTRV